MIKAHEIQGVIALENSFNRVGLDHVLLVKVATTAVVAQMLGCSYEEIVNAVSQAWVDGQSLRTYRHAPNTGSRKSWAAGDATSRGVRLALISKTGEMGYPSVLSAKTWGFYDVSFKGRPFKFQRPFGSYVMENVLFKISYPAEFHAQTAVECAMQIHAALKAQNRTPDDIKKITIRTHEACHADHRQERPARQPGRPRPLHPVHGGGADPVRPPDRRRLRGRGRRRPAHRRAARQDYLRRGQAASPATITTLTSARSPTRSRVEFKDGTKLGEFVCEYPIGHKRRRKEGMPLLVEKFKRNLARRFPSKQQNAILDVCMNPGRLHATPVDEFVDLFVI